ncbi:MAG: MFS transporter [Bacillota bacterium]|nr:MFS transporter [Bacillota bacterium]
MGKGTASVSVLGKMAYGAGNLGFGAAFQVLGAYAMFFATDILGISGIMAGWAIGIGTIWDAVIDPVTGHISDITRSKRFGRRHAYLLFGGIGMSISIALFWCVPAGWEFAAKFSWFFIWMMLFRTFSAVFSTPYNALGAELCEDYNERTALQGYKTAFFVLGLLFPSIVVTTIFFRPTPAYVQGQFNPDAYPQIGIALGILALALTLVCFAGTLKHIKRLPKPAETREKGYFGKLYGSLLAAMKNKDFRHVAFGYLFINIASALVAGLGIYVFTYAFKMTNLEIAFVFGGLFIIAVCSQPLWWLISRKLDKKPALLTAMAACLFGMACFLVILFIREEAIGKPYLFLPFMLAAGAGVGGVLTLPHSMVADTIDKTELETGERKDGTFFGCLTFLYKFSQAVAMIAMGVLIDVIKQSSKDASLPLGLVLCIGCMLSFFIAAAVVAGYKLKKSDVEEIQKKIASRKEAVKNGVGQVAEGE